MKFNSKIAQLILSTIPDAVAWKGLDLVYIGCNLPFAKAAGLRSPDEIIGKTDHDLSWKENATRFIQTDKQVIHSKQAILNMVEFYHFPDKDDLWIELNLLPINENIDSVIGLLIIFRDISTEMNDKQKLYDAKNNLEHQVNQRTADLILAREQAEQANIAKTQFLSSMSHELRTPLNAILGFAQLLQLDYQQTNQSDSEDINEIIIAGNHLLELINEILDLAKIESGKLSLSIESINIYELTKECLNQIKPQILERNLIVTDIDELLNNQADNPYKNQYVRADRTRLKQVLLNLISNAIKYNCKNGTLTVSWKYLEENHIRISVIDTGPGLTKEQQSKLFSPFERLGAESTNTQGTGIGLVICKSIIEAMHGHIGYKSEPGTGSEFWVELPQVQDSAAPDNETIEYNESSTDGFLSKKVILYIEDNPANERMLARFFEYHPSIQLITASEAYSGIQIAQTHAPDLILLDINLPGMNGYEALKKLHESEITQHIPIFAISANSLPSDIKKGLNAGFKQYISKPINLNELKQSIDNELCVKI